MMPGHRSRQPQEQVVYDLIVNEFFPKVRFTADDVYSHDSNPPDLDMYAALDQLVSEGKLQKVMRLWNDRSHDTMVYAVAGEDGYRHCFCRDCFETTIGPPGEFCHECEEAACETGSDCQRPDAYGMHDTDELL